MAGCTAAPAIESGRGGATVPLMRARELRLRMQKKIRAAISRPPTTPPTTPPAVRKQGHEAQSSLAFVGRLDLRRPPAAQLQGTARKEQPDWGDYSGGLPMMAARLLLLPPDWSSWEGAGAPAREAEMLSQVLQAVKAGQAGVSGSGSRVGLPACLRWAQHRKGAVDAVAAADEQLAYPESEGSAFSASSAALSSCSSISVGGGMAGGGRGRGGWGLGGGGLGRGGAGLGGGFGGGGLGEGGGGAPYT